MNQSINVSIFDEVNTPLAKGARKIIAYSTTAMTLTRPLALLLTVLVGTVMNAFGQTGSSPFPTSGQGFFKTTNTLLLVLLFLVTIFGVAMLGLAGYYYFTEGSMKKPLIAGGMSLGAWTVLGGMIWNLNHGGDMDIPDVEIGE